jgi:hypothetical protein
MERVLIIFLWLAVLFVPDEIVYSHPAKKSEAIAKSNNFSVFEENGKVGLKDEEGDILIPAPTTRSGGATASYRSSIKWLVTNPAECGD